MPCEDEQVEIQIGRWYGEGQGKARRIVSIRQGVVTYALKGVLNFRPLSAALRSSGDGRPGRRCVARARNDRLKKRTDGSETTRVGDLIKAREITREDVVAAISSVFDGKTALSLSGGYELILPELAKMTPYSREAMMSALIEGKARKE